MASSQTATRTAWQIEARRVAHNIRSRVLALTLLQGGSYLSQACSSADILATLYTHVLKLGPSLGPLTPPRFVGVPGSPGYTSGGLYHGPHAPEYDRFFISPTHYSVAVYAALVELGRLAPEALAEFNTDGSIVEMIGGEHSPGLELTTGSFGQALSQAAGIAMARQRRGDTGRVFVFVSDGELQEGQMWEAFQQAAFYRQDNLAVFVDANGQQVDGRTEHVMAVEPLDAKLGAFGWQTCKVDGHDPAALAACVDAWEPGRPLAVLAYTKPTQGIDLLQERWPMLHYVRFKDAAERARYEAYLHEQLPLLPREG